MAGPMLAAEANEVLLSTYTRVPVTLVRGSGCYVEPPRTVAA